MEKRKQWANRIFLGIFSLTLICCFLSQQIYSMMAPFASLMAFAGFLVLLFCYENVWKRLFEKDVELWLVGITSVIALFNLFWLHSNKGAFLTAADLLLMLYLVPRVRFNREERLVIEGCGALFLIWWFGNVKWEYNFNMVGLVYMTLCFLGLLFLEHLKNRWALAYLSKVQILLYVTTTLYTLLYHSRCALLGMLLFGILLLGGKVIEKHKSVWIALILSATIGSLLFTLLYIWIGKTGMEITILYKDILSGRQDIWAELWEAFLQKPFTGIGSSYHLKSFFIFEVHNGLLDILTVHGVFVFAFVLYLLIRRLLEFYDQTGTLMYQRIARAAVLVILFTSFFENYFIVSPYLCVLFFLLTCTEGVDLV